MSLGIRFRFDEQRSLAYGSIGATYMGVGSALTNAARQIFIQNLTNGIMQFSFDGVTDHFVLPPNGFMILDITANKTQDQGFYLSEGERLYVKEISTPSSGTVYFSVMYGSLS